MPTVIAGMVTDRYVVSRNDVNDLGEAYGADAEKILDAAIEMCKERAKLFVLPCNWIAEFRADGTILVKRQRSKTK